MPKLEVARRRQNEWYEHTYQTILDMANWSEFASDIERKIVCVFSWMPQGIMHVKDKGERLKAELYSPADLVASLRSLEGEFQVIRNCELQTAILDQLVAKIDAVWVPLYRFLGASAASKYLHFSIPRFLPMSDRAIREHYCGKKRIDDYLYYIELFQDDLKNDLRQQKAREACPANWVRGLDIVNMRGDLPPMNKHHDKICKGLQ